ncbi:MAG: ABC transporter ATP-binding protein [Acidimicrobiia bacterium]|nr:ABC transporter ATP-binding protein [Acidimicrobiia bacterium]
MTDARFATDATVEVRDVSKWFGQKVAVSELSCSFGPGVTGLLGPNGAGKTTFLRMMVGLLTPSEGEIRLLGESPRSQPDVFRRVGFVHEDEAVYEVFTAREFVTFNAALFGVADPGTAADQALETVGLTDVANRKVGTFSKGMRQRAKVAAALAHDPTVLFLDEPLNGTDPLQRAHLIDLFSKLAERGHTVIVSSHVLHEVERMAGRVIAMVDGRLAAAGSVTDLRTAMTDIPRRIRIDTDVPRKVGAALLIQDWVEGVKLVDGTIHVEVRDPVSLGHRLPALCRDLGARLTRVDPEDTSLESVFRYLVKPR